MQIHLYIGSRLIIAVQIRVFLQMNYPYFTNIPLNRIAVDRWLTAIQIRGYLQKIFQGVFRKYSRPAPEQPNETVPPTATPADPRATLLIYPPASASLASRALRWHPSSFAGAAAAPRQSPAETVTAPRGRRGGCSFVASEEAPRGAEFVEHELRREKIGISSRSTREPDATRHACGVCKR